MSAVGIPALQGGEDVKITETCSRPHHPLAKKHLKQQVIDWHWNWNAYCSTAKTTWS